MTNLILFLILLALLGGAPLVFGAVMVGIFFWIAYEIASYFINLPEYNEERDNPFNKTMEMT